MTKLVSLRDVLATRDDMHIADGIWSLVTKACHHVLSLALSTQRPFATDIPYAPPLFKCHKERHASFSGVSSVLDVGEHLRVGLAPRIDRFTALGCGRGIASTPESVNALPVCSIVSAAICAARFFVFKSHSLWSSQPGSWVRGGTDVDASMSSRLYRGHS